jgi:hypothetical protein
MGSRVLASAADHPDSIHPYICLFYSPEYTQTLLDPLVTRFRQTASRDQRCTVLNEVVTTDVVFDIIRKKRGVFVNEPPDPR